MKKIYSVIALMIAIFCTSASASASWEFETTYMCSAEKLTEYNGSYIIKYSRPLKTNGGISVAFRSAEFLDIYGEVIDSNEHYDSFEDAYTYISDPDIYKLNSDPPNSDADYMTYTSYFLDFGRYSFDVLNEKIYTYCKQDGYYIKRIDNKYGITTTDYEEILPCEYDDIHYCYSDIFALTDETGTSLINIKTGTIIVPADEGYTEFYFFKNGLCAAKARDLENPNKSYGAVIDITGKRVLSGANRYQLGENGIIVVRNTAGDYSSIPEWSVLKTLYHPSFVSLNDDILTTESIIVNERTLFPMREIAEKLGANVLWDENTQTVTVSNTNTTVIFQIDNDTVKVNDTALILDTAPQIINNVAMLPVRALAEAFGAEVSWNENTRVAKILI